jgi:hypothetical protein
MASAIHDQTEAAVRHPDGKRAPSRRRRPAAGRRVPRARRSHLVASAVATVTLAAAGMIAISAAAGPGHTTPGHARPALADTTRYGYYMRP